MKLFDGIKEKLGALGGAKGLIYIAAALAAGLLCLFLSRGDACAAEFGQRGERRAGHHNLF